MITRPTPFWVDALLLGGSILACVVAGFMADLTLRQWSATLGALSFGGIVYCSLATWHTHAMNALAQALAVTLAVVLITSAFAQYLLIKSDILHPPNQLGLAFLIGARVLVLVLVLAWSRLVLTGRPWRG